MRPPVVTVVQDTSTREPMPDFSEIVFVTLISFFVCILLLGAVAGMVKNVANVIHQHESQQFPMTTGRVTLSTVERELVQGKDKTRPPTPYYWPEIRYQYEVNGKIYRESRRRYGERIRKDSDPAPANRLVAAHPRGSEIAVYYNPVQPEDALLEPGMVPHDLCLFPIFALGAVGLLASRFVSSWWRDNFVRPDTGGVRIIAKGDYWRARLPRFSPFMLSMATALVLALTATFVVDGLDHPVSYREVVYGWAAVIAGPAIVFGALFIRVASGVEDLVIDRETDTLTLPQNFGRWQSVTLPISRVASADLIESGTGRQYQCHPTLFFSDPALRSARLGNWIDQRKGRSFISWLRGRLWL